MINQFIQRLETELGDFKRVDHAWDVEPFKDVDAADMPIALAFVASDSSEESNADSCGVKQRMTRELWVYTVCATDELEDRRAELFDAALGWQAGPEWYPLQHRRGETRQIRGNYIWWLDVFATWRTIRQP